MYIGTLCSHHRSWRDLEKNCRLERVVFFGCAEGGCSCEFEIVMGLGKKVFFLLSPLRTSFFSPYSDKLGVLHG